MKKALLAVLLLLIFTGCTHRYIARFGIENGQAYLETNGKPTSNYDSTLLSNIKKQWDANLAAQRIRDSLLTVQASQALLQRGVVVNTTKYWVRVRTGNTAIKISPFENKIVHLLPGKVTFVVDFLDENSRVIRTSIETGEINSTKNEYQLLGEKFDCIYTIR